MSAKDKSGLEDSPVTDRFAKVEGMHVIPTPMTGNYMPPKSDFGIDESKFTYVPKQSTTSESNAKTSDLDSCDFNSSVETLESVPKPVANEPKAVSKPKVWSDAPIIEEYESDSDDEHVTITSKEQEKPSFGFVNIVEHLKTTRKTIKEHHTCIRNPKPNNRDWDGLMSKRMGLGYGFTKKACFVCGNFSHLIRDCDFHEKRMAKQIELTKQKGQILTKTGRFPVNAARYKFTSQAALTNTARKVNNARPKDNPHQTLKGKGIVDNGCSRHMTGNKAYLFDYQDFHGGPVAFVGSKGQITGKGKIKSRKLNFEDVYFVKELQHFNLFSVSQMCDKKKKVLLTFTECLVLSHDFKLPNENQVLLRVLRHHNMYNFNLKNIIPSRSLACLIEKATIDESTKWHRSTEFKNKDVIKFCGSKGIKREYSNAGTSKKNGVAERRNRTLIKVARTMLADLFLTNTFWAEAVSTTCYVLNRILVTKPQNKTPYELLTGKFAKKSDEGFLVGYSLSSKAFRAYNLETKRVEENLHINFLENKPNVARKGPPWLFDLDYLTDSINYQPITTENKANHTAGPKETNNSAGAARASGNNFVNTATTLLNAASTPTKQDDSQIPTLEDIYDHSREWIFTSASYDDEGALADFTNLETTVNVSPISTSRIQSIHPITKILGDPTSTVQTRSKVNKSLRAYGFVSYIQKQRRTNHKDFQHCLFACFRSQNKPKKISQACKDESWVDAMQEELLQFQIQKVWILVDLPFGKKAIGTKWVYMNKKDEKGVVVRNKARLVAQGHSVKTASTLIETKKPLVKDEEAAYVDVHFYRSMIGSLMYLTSSRPDIMYLKGQPKLGLWYPRESAFDLEAYLDSDYAGANLDRKSAIGGCTGGSGGNHVKLPHDSPLLSGYTSDKVEGSLNLEELSDLCTNLSNRVFALDTVKDAQAKEILTLKARIKKLEEVESVSKQGRKNAKSGPTKDDSAKLDAELDEDMEYIDTEEAMNEGWQSTVDTTMPDDDTARPDVSTARQELSTAGPITPTTTTTIFDDEEITLADTLIKLNDDKAKGVAFKDLEYTNRPTRSILTLKPLPTIDPKYKGKEVERERHGEEQASMNYIANLYDEVQARIDASHELVVRWTHEEREKYTVVERAKLLAEYFERRKKQLAEERAAAIRNKPPTKTQLRRLMMTYLKNMGRFTHSQLNKKSFKDIQGLYVKEQELIANFVPIGSEEDERRIRDRNKKAEEESSAKGVNSTKKRKAGSRMKRMSKRQKTDFDLEEDEKLKTFLKIDPDEEGIIDYEVLDKRFPIIKWESKFYHYDRHGAEGIYYRIFKSDGSSRWIKTFFEMVIRFDRLDLVELYNMVMQILETTIPEGVDLTLWGDLRTIVHILILKDGTEIHMLAERRLINLEAMIEERRIFKCLFYHHTTNGHQFTMSNRHQELTSLEANSFCKELASPKLTALGKDISNPLIVDSLLKTLWLSMHHVIAMKHWQFQSKRLLLGQTNTLVHTAARQLETNTPFMLPNKHPFYPLQPERKEEKKETRGGVNGGEVAVVVFQWWWCVKRASEGEWCGWTGRSGD
nr:hypothetical protein [Tanacetum cinerariifolium]